LDVVEVALGSTPGADTNTWSKEAMTMLMRTDPFRELDRLTQQVFGQTGTWSRPAVMPMEAYRQGEQFVVHFDLPGVDPESIDVNVERNVLTVKAQRQPTTESEQWETLVAERPYGVFSRQLFLGETLDTDRIEAHYDAGVLTLRIPVAEQAKPRKIEISAGGKAKEITS
jgi:HSP20 family protein